MMVVVRAKGTNAVRLVKVRTKHSRTSMSKGSKAMMVANMETRKRNNPDKKRKEKKGMLETPNL